MTNRTRILSPISSCEQPFQQIRPIESSSSSAKSSSSRVPRVLLLTVRYRLKLLVGEDESKLRGKGDASQKNMNEKERMIQEKLGVHVKVVERDEMTQLFKKCSYVDDCDYFAVDFEKATLLVA